MAETYEERRAQPPTRRGKTVNLEAPTMHRFLYGATAFFYFAVISTLPSSAVTTHILAQPHSPVKIQNCYAGTTDSSVGNKNYYLDFAGVFKNISSKNIDAVRYRFDVFNDFGEHLRDVYGTDDQTFSAYTTMDDARHDTSEEQMMSNSGNSVTIFRPTWEFININDTASEVLCSVDTVKFMDGSMWKATLTKSQMAVGLKAPFETSIYIFSTHSDGDSEP